MKKVLFTLFILLVAASIYLLFNPNKFYEQVFKFGQQYEKASDDNVRIYVPPSVTYDTGIAFEQLQKTRELARKLFNQNLEHFNSIAIFITEPGYRGHERIANITGGYFYAMDVILINGEEPQYISSSIAHEYMHFLMNHYLQEQKQGLAIEEIPDWLTEGLAEYIAFQVEQALPQKHALYYDHFPFPQLHEMTNSNVGSIYLQGFYAVHDLIEQFGENVMSEILSTYLEVNDFSLAFTQVTGIDYHTYHGEFFINRNELAKLNELKTSKKQVITYGEELLNNRASINPYGPFVLPNLIGAALEMGDVPLALDYFNKLEPMLFNPNDYLYYAADFHEAGETKFAQQLVEQARINAAKYYFDIEEFEREVEKKFE